MFINVWLSIFEEGSLIGIPYEELRETLTSLHKEEGLKSIYVEIGDKLSDSLELEDFYVRHCNLGVVKVSFYYNNNPWEFEHFYVDLLFSSYNIFLSRYYKYF